MSVTQTRRPGRDRSRQLELKSPTDYFFVANHRKISWSGREEREDGKTRFPVCGSRKGKILARPRGTRRFRALSRKKNTNDKFASSYFASPRFLLASSRCRRAIGWALVKPNIFRHISDAPASRSRDRGGCVVNCTNKSHRKPTTADNSWNIFELSRRSFHPAIYDSR